MKHRLILTIGFIFSVLLWGLGYRFLIIPQQKNIVFFNSLVRKVKSNRIQKRAPKTTQPFSAKDDVLRWLSDEGRIVMWKKQKKSYDFVWEGSYQAMLTLVLNWPDGLKVQTMHWERRSPVGIKWRGRYAIHD